MTENTTTPDHTAARPTWIGRCVAAAQALQSGARMRRLRADWLRQCKDRYMRAGCTDEVAAEFAVTCAEGQAAIYGTDPARWDPPAEAADEDMSYWGD